MIVASVRHRDRLRGRSKGKKEGYSMWSGGFDLVFTQEVLLFHIGSKSGDPLSTLGTIWSREIQGKSAETPRDPN